MNVDRLVLSGVLLLTLCRWVLAASLELTGEEAVYWMESKRLAPFFLEEGPLVAGLIRAGTWALGDTVLGIRAFNPLLILLATWILYLLARSVYHQVAARWSVLVFQLCPVVNVAGVLMMDVALAIFLALAGFWCLWCGLHRANRWHGFWWAGGLILGLAMTLSLALSSLLLGIGAALALTSRWRAQWGRPGIWIMLLVASLTTAAFYAASGHGDSAFRQHFHGFGFHPEQLAAAILSWSFWTGPLLILGIVWSLGSLRGLRFSHGARLLAIMGWVSLGTAFLWSCLVEPWNFMFWAGTVPCLVVLLGQWMQADIDLIVKSRWRHWALLTTGGLAVIGVNTENLRILGLPWPRAASTPRLEQGWVETARAIEAALLTGGMRQPDGLFVIAEDHQTAALLDFYLTPEALLYRPHPAYSRVHVIESAGRESVYDLWPNYSHALPGSKEPSPFRGMTGLYVTRQTVENVPSNIVHAFKSLEPAAVLEIKRENRLLHRWHIYHVYQYRGLPL